MVDTVGTGETAQAAPEPVDVRIWTADSLFKFRVSALVVRDGRLLTTSHPGAGYCYLPGGKVRIGETSAAAMRRELIEEIGHDLPVGPLVLIAENIYERDDTQRHELTFYYVVDPPAALTAEQLTGSPEPGHELGWIPFPELASEGFRPTGVIPMLPELTASGAILRHGLFDHPVAS